MRPLKRARENGLNRRREVGQEHAEIVDGVI
jgi:hypothetical protein